MLEPIALLGAVDFSSLPQQLVNGILLGAIYALIALGYTMVYGVLRLINFAHGEVFMLGAYAALLTSWAIGFAPGTAFTKGEPVLAPATVTYIGFALLAIAMVVVFVGRSRNRGQAVGLALPGGVGLAGLLVIVLAQFQPQAINLVVMMLASMSTCALVGVLIERFAYRPMRGYSRIASLITAIGVSLFLQFGGQLFLPSSPPPSINESVNPYRDTVTLNLKRPSAETQQALESALPAVEAAQKELDAYIERTGEARFKLGPEGIPLRDNLNEAEKALRDARGAANQESIRVLVPKGQLIMLATALVLMGLLRYLVMKTATGRAMRAVSHDFDSASLMGINVSRIITITFVIGSALAGAGAMMTATFFGTPLTPFYGVQPGVKAFVAAVLGGIGNIPGAVLGGLLMGIAESLVVWMGGSGYRDAIAFVVLIVVLLFRPGGILGSSKVEKV